MAVLSASASDVDRPCRCAGLRRRGLGRVRGREPARGAGGLAPRGWRAAYRKSRGGSATVARRLGLPLAEPGAGGRERGQRRYRRGQYRRVVFVSQGRLRRRAALVHAGRLDAVASELSAGPAAGFPAIGGRLAGRRALDTVAQSRRTRRGHGAGTAGDPQHQPPSVSLRRVGRGAVVPE